VLLTERDRAAPHLVRCRQKLGGREVAIDVLHGIAMHAHHFEHRLAVQRIALEWALAGSHRGGERVRFAGHHSRHCRRVGSTRI
jgi:hypothetical protein